MSEPGKHANRLGPKPCLDEEKQKQVCTVIGQGMSLQSAADMICVHVKTIYRHARRDKKFDADLRQARARGEFRLLRTVHEAGAEKGEWRAAAWVLKNCYRDRYYQRQQGIPVEQIRVIIERLAGAMLGEVRNKEDRERMVAHLKRISGEVSEAARVNLRLGNES